MLTAIHERDTAFLLACAFISDGEGSKALPYSVNDLVPFSPLLSTEVILYA